MYGNYHGNQKWQILEPKVRPYLNTDRKVFEIILNYLVLHLFQSPILMLPSLERQQKQLKVAFLSERSHAFAISHGERNIFSFLLC